MSKLDLELLEAAGAEIRKATLYAEMLRELVASLDANHDAADGYTTGQRLNQLHREARALLDGDFDRAERYLDGLRSAEKTDGECEDLPF